MYNYKNRISIVFAMHDINNINTINAYHAITYKNLIKEMIPILSNFSSSKIKSLINKAQITIKISEIRINKLNKKAMFFTIELHYQKGSIYFDRFMSDIFSKLI